MALYHKEEFEMMTKQAELKKQAYAGTLKSRALSVLIYLIDRSNKELTCFPAIPTMAKQLHISVSTVKRALRELVDSGYIKKDSRFRDHHRGQTSNLYTLVLFEGQAMADGDKADDLAGSPKYSEAVEEPQENRKPQEKCRARQISFAELVEENNKISEKGEQLQRSERADSQEIEIYKSLTCPWTGAEVNLVPP